MQQHPKPIDEDFPEQTYRQQLKRYSTILAERLSILDNETKWDDYFFAPLEAEVEVVSGRRSRKKIVDLMQALKTEQTSRIVLVLGDPGAGKSVALRKLAKELLKEVEQTGRLPVYINLKEWSTERTWNEQSPPSTEELREFILRRLKGDSAFADGFLGKYFERMIDRGRLFFILDSFDEIPGVLDVSEASWLIQHLSRMIMEFFISQEAGRGIVSSRFYRRPKFNRNDCATVEIRPFSDLRIHEALMRSEKLSPVTIEKLFSTRPELIPIARNPFSAALIRIYAESHGGGLPASQLDMYESYIQGRFEASTDEMKKRGINADELLAGATDIAWSMFEASEVGLEAPIPKLAELLPCISVPAITAVLRFSGLARLSSTTDASFSFVHRRLNEYFVARKLLKSPERVALNAIPTDSRYRDALVLYCEVGEAGHVENIAAFCWEQVVAAPPELGVDANNQSLRAVHCMRFLRDAFRTRCHTLTFIPDLARYISERVKPGGDLLLAKLALEATGLLPEADSEPILIAAFGIRNSWISETALRSCQHLKQIGAHLKNSMRDYLSSIPINGFLNRRRELIFSLSLSDAFRDLRRYCVIRSFDYQSLALAIAVCILLSPIVLLLALLVVGIGSYPSLRFTRSVQTIPRLYSAGWLFLLGMAVFFTPASPLHSVARKTGGIYGLWISPVLASHLFHGHTARYLALAYILTSIFIFPLLDLYIIITTRWRSLISWKSVQAILGVMAMFFLMALLTKWSEPHPLIARTFLWFVIFLSVLAGLLQTGQMSVRHFNDYRVLRRTTSSTAVTRSFIAETFERFETSWYRLRYVEWIRDSQIQPYGAWPKQRPNHTDDRASALLAQLDEHWLGLDA